MNIPYITMSSPVERLCEWYEAQVGYDPIKDDPEMTIPQLKQLVQEYLAEWCRTEGLAAPVVTLKNVKHAAFASEETFCYEATAYVDGKRFCIVSNDGHGGCDSQHHLKGEDYAAHNEKMRQLEMRIIGTASEEDLAAAQDGTFWYLGDFEAKCGEAMNRHVTLQQMKNALGRKTCFRIPGKPGLWTMAAKFDAHVAHHLIEKYPGCVIVNLVAKTDPDEALGWYFDDLPDPRKLVAA